MSAKTSNDRKHFDLQMHRRLALVVGQTINDRKFNPALFARRADSNGLALIQRCRALR